MRDGIGSIYGIGIIKNVKTLRLTIFIAPIHRYFGAFIIRQSTKNIFVHRKHTGLSRPLRVFILWSTFQSCICYGLHYLIHQKYRTRK